MVLIILPMEERTGFGSVKKVFMFAGRPKQGIPFSWQEKMAKWERSPGNNPFFFVCMLNHSSIQKPVSFLERYSFLIFAAILVIVESILILQGTWNRDFWEHAAAVHELSRNPFNPSNPIINADLPHAYLSPYSLILGLFSRVTGLDPFNTLVFLLSLISSFFFFITIEGLGNLFAQ